MFFTTDLSIHASCGTYYLSIILKDYNSKGTGTYNIKSFDVASASLNTNSMPVQMYQTGSDPFTGQLTITTFDKTNKIISGTFYFKAENGSNGDSLNITSGTFSNLKW